MAADVNNLRWKIGWKPWTVIIGITVVFTIIGAAVGEVGWLFALGVMAGIVTWYWGVMEINDKYKPFIKKFIGESERNAKRRIEVDDAELYNLTYNSGSSPPLVKPANVYTNTTIVVTDTSINLNEGARYDMRERSGAGGGTNKEFYYDQVTGVQSHQDGAFTELEIKTAGGGSTRISSSATDIVDEVVADVRQRVREVKNPGSNARTKSQRQSRPTSQGGRDRRQESVETASGASAADRDDEPETEGPVDAAQPDENPVTSAVDAVSARTRPGDPLANELCRVLSRPSPDEERLETVLEETVERLERTGTVADAVAAIDDPTAESQVESAKRTLGDQEGPIATNLDAVFDHLLEVEAERDTEPADGTRETIAELEDELERKRREHDRIRSAADTVCREASRSEIVSFRSNDVVDRTATLADALESGEVVLETPETEPSMAAVVDDVERSVRPQTPQSRTLLETIGDPDEDDREVASVLRSTVETLDEFAELQAAVADIGERDVRRRLDSLDDELRTEDGPIYRHLADRVRELEAMVDRDGVDDVQLYAIYQECTFYDRTLLPRLSRSQPGSGSTDVAQLASDVEARIEAIENEYVNVRADHNHTIPTHFLSLAGDLHEEAAALETNQPERAAGLLSAATELLGHVEQLYERNEYSVMLRRLRG